MAIFHHTFLRRPNFSELIRHNLSPRGNLVSSQTEPGRRSMHKKVRPAKGHSMCSFLCPDRGHRRLIRSRHCKHLSRHNSRGSSHAPRKQFGPRTDCSHRVRSSCQGASMSTAITVHIAAATLSVILGTAVLLTEKGTPRHKWLGRLWAAAMFATTLSSFDIRELNPGH